MEQGNKAFNEVRALLGKLDRSIDEARSRRLGPPAHAESSPNQSESPDPSSIDLDQEIGQSAAKAEQTELQKRGALFGRAKPLNRDPNTAWKSTGNNDNDMQIG
ncbi:MAG: hypothetical protein JKY96_00375 [Phycisphaerales bacterium]|nr:hypothetical protein [Phycisphaerales bacterium]